MKSIKLLAFTVIFAVSATILVTTQLRNSDIVKVTNKTILSTKNVVNKKQADIEKQYKLGYDLFFANKYAAAIAAENQVIKQDPSFYKAYAVKGIALAYSKDYKGALAQINHSLQLKPTYGYAMFNKALTYELFGYYDDAIVWYKKDLQVEKNFEWSYYGIASIYGRKGDVTNTVKYLKLAIHINPNVKTIAKSESDFNNVKQYVAFKQLLK